MRDGIEADRRTAVRALLVGCSFSFNVALVVVVVATALALVVERRATI
jgi:uncharacterized protein YcsI (UPF0317 family)